MSGVIPPLPQYAFMAWCSVKGTGLHARTGSFWKSCTEIRNALLMNGSVGEPVHIAQFYS